MNSLGNEDKIDSKDVSELLGISQTNLRQLVFRKELTVMGRKHRRSQFSRTEVLALGKRRSEKRITGI